PAPLETRDPLGHVTLEDPPAELPGMVMLRLDTEGRLLELEAVPLSTADAAKGALGPDWAPVLREAGLDPGALREAPPLATPPVYADSRMAWEAVAAGGGPRRIEAAALAGRHVSFRFGSSAPA